MISRFFAPGALVLALSALCLVSPSEAAEVAHSPVVPGFPVLLETESPEAAGRLLLSELNCTACHRAEPDVESSLRRKQAPVLDQLGARVQREYLRTYLTDPHAAKPGTSMPHVLAVLPENQRAQAIEALVHFLASTGAPSHARPDRRAIGQGKMFYHRYGCAACHGGEERQKVAPKPEPDAEFPEESVVTRGTPPPTVPLGNLVEKYTVPGLSRFLLNPLESRPSGRMPSLNLNRQEADAIASYLLADLRVDLPKNVQFAYFEGNWEKLPDLSTLEPVKTGQCSGFDVLVGPRRDGFAIRFETQLDLASAGNYRFELASDDGSALEIDGKRLIENDGIHPRQTVSAQTDLTKGSHTLVVLYFEGGGEEELEVSIQGPRIARQDLANLVHRPGEALPADDDKSGLAFRVNPEIAEMGKVVFGSLGCASCHQLRSDGKVIEPTESTLMARALADLDPSGGCLADSPRVGVPHFSLSADQRSALRAALKSPSVPSEPEAVLAHSLAAFDCVACHRRGNLGGVSDTTNPYFETTQQEMGDEGRIPPPLDGVGAKLNADWLNHILNDGAKDRPYMLTRMPKFGGGNVGHLRPVFEKLDHLDPVPVPEFAESDRRVKEDGRAIVGKTGFNCVGCHTFRGIESTGVQGIDMALMTRRVRRDWFHRYVVDPQSFRPGTRMPTAWPDGQSTLPSVLDGRADLQIESIWRYLSDGGNATIPSGVGREPIPLAASNGEAILYRNFIEGAGPRAIGVGYPEGANLAFDANTFRVSLVWQGEFMDASRHWIGRGQGFQPPMGRNVLKLPDGPSLARLNSRDEPWPTEPPRSLDYHFLGYRLSPDRRPTFRYDLGPIHVENRPEIVKPGDRAFIEQVLSISSKEPTESLYLRAAVAGSIEPLDDGGFRINNDWTTRIEGGGEPFIRESEGKKELLVPVPLRGKPVTIRRRIEW